MVLSHRAPNLGHLLRPEALGTPRPAMTVTHQVERCSAIFADPKRMS
jgi:hypothetical protein